MPIHVYPVNDGTKHDTDGGECWCRPRVEWLDSDGMPYADGPLIVHSSADGSEIGENHGNGDC